MSACGHRHVRGVGLGCSARVTALLRLLSRRRDRRRQQAAYGLARVRVLDTDDAIVTPYTDLLQPSSGTDIVTLALSAQTCP